MVRFVSVGIDIVSVAVVLVPIMFILYDTCLKKYDLGKKLWLFWFVFYLSAVCSVTGIPTVNHLVAEPNFHLIPFLDIINDPAAYIKNSILNIVLFVPLGFLLPVIWRERYRSLRKVILSGLGVSAAIELLQIFTFRLTDIDDLITNAAGASLGYYLAKLYTSRKCRQVTAKQETDLKEGFFCKYEPYLMMLVVFLIMFLIQPLVAENIWESVLDSTWWERIKGVLTSMFCTYLPV